MAANFVRRALGVLGDIGSNREYLDYLNERLDRLTPFIGAGLSVEFGYPSWDELLREAAKPLSCRDAVARMLDTLEYEEAAEAIAAESPEQFEQRLAETFSASSLARPLNRGAVRFIPTLASGLVLTTNFDSVLEAAFRDAHRPFEGVFAGTKIVEASRAVQDNKRALLKLHGSAEAPETRVLTLAEYRRAYGDGMGVDASGRDSLRALPNILAQALGARPVLFLGCSLRTDRTTRIISEIIERLPGLTHFALLQELDNTEERRRQLQQWNIWPLYFRNGEFRSVERFLMVLSDAVVDRREAKAHVDVDDVSDDERQTLTRWSVAAAASIGVAVSAGSWLWKWLEYPGYTWAGFLDESRGAGLVITGALLLALFASKRMGLALGSGVSRTTVLRAVVTGFGVIATAAAVGLAIVGERDFSQSVVIFAENSDWRRAALEVRRLSALPLREDVKETLSLYVDAHSSGELDQLPPSQDLRSGRQAVRALLDHGRDHRDMNSLAFAEFSKDVGLVENNLGMFREGIERINEALETTSAPYRRASLLRKRGEIHLAEKSYSAARNDFASALEVERRPVSRARIKAALGNTFVSEGQIAEGEQLYGEAETDYPEGRRHVFYSSWGYIAIRAGKFEEATDRVRRALQIRPEDWYSYLNLGLAEEGLGRLDDAYNSFSTVIDHVERGDAMTEAKILRGRNRELASRPLREVIAAYLDALDRGATAAQVSRIASDTDQLRRRYEDAADRLRLVNTHGIEIYVDWFVDRSEHAVAAQPTPLFEPKTGTWDMAIVCPAGGTVREENARFEAGQYRKSFMGPTASGETRLTLTTEGPGRVHAFGVVQFAQGASMGVDASGEEGETGHYSGVATYGSQSDCRFIATEKVP